MDTRAPSHKGTITFEPINSGLFFLIQSSLLSFLKVMWNTYPKVQSCRPLVSSFVFETSTCARPFTARALRISPSGAGALLVFLGSARSPQVRKQAPAWRARWCIQPCCHSCIMMAFIQGKSVLTSLYAASRSLSSLQGIFLRTGMPSMWSKRGVPWPTM
jgi:hypothetical protein